MRGRRAQYARYGPGEPRAASVVRRRRSRAPPGGSRRRPGAREQIDEVALEAIGVLELVHHDRLEAQRLPLADLRVVAEKRSCCELEILEIEGRLAALRRGVCGGEAVQELLEEIPVPHRELVERRLLEGDPGLLVAGGALAASAMSRQVEQVVGPRLARHCIEERRRASALQLCRRAVLHEAAGGLAQLLEPLVNGRAFAELEDEVAAGRAQRLVDPGDHPPQAARAVGRQQSRALLVVRAAERREHFVEGLAREDRGLRVVQLTEPWVETCFERRRLQQPVAEPVDRRDIGAVEAPSEVRAATAPQLGTDPGPQLSGSPLGVGDDEDRLHVEPALAHRFDEALDEDSGLAGPRAGRHEDPPAGVDRRTLLVVRRPVHARLTLHIVQRSHHAGHSPPLGSWTTSPSRIRPAKRRAVSFAPSTCFQKASSSR